MERQPHWTFLEVYNYGTATLTLGSPSKEPACYGAPMTMPTSTTTSNLHAMLLRTSFEVFCTHCLPPMPVLF